MDDLKRLATAIVATLQQHGYQAVFAGGCVRDVLMGREPADYDIATNATPQDVMALFPKTVPVGISFGVVRVVADSHDFEVATFRTETGYLDHRHPEVVEFCDARNDVMRRDFTINAMLFDPIKAELLDFVGGQADIAAGVVRTVGDPAARFEDDYLRLIRAVRFATRFGYRIEDATLRAIQATAEKITQVSRERIGQELLKIFGGPNPHVGLQLLSDTSLLAHVLPEVEAMKGVEQPANFHPEGDVFQHTLLALKVMGPPRSPEFGVAVMLHDVGKPPTMTRADRIRFSNHAEIGAEMVDQIAERLRFSNEQAEYIRNLVKDHMRFINVREMKESTLKRFLRGRQFADLLELHRIDCLASHGDLGAWEFCKQKLEQLGKDEIAPPRLITGTDLIELGYEPGAVFKEILAAVEDAQLEGKIREKQEAVQFVEEHFPQRVHE